MSGTTVPLLDCLYGSRRGSRQPLRESEIWIGTARRADVHFAEDDEPAVSRLHARLERLPDGGYLLEAQGEAYVTVNGRVVDRARLAAGDLIRIGEGGPVLRYRVEADETLHYRRLRDVVADVKAGARAGTRGTVGRAATVARHLPGDLLMKTRPILRWSLAAVFVVVCFAVVALFLRTSRLEESLRLTTEGVDAIALEMSRDRSMSGEEIARLRSEMDTATERLNALGDLEPDAVGLLEAASESVVFLQGAFGFRNAQGSMLRIALDDRGRPRTDGRGNQLLSTAATGPVYERQYTGSGFVATGEGHILTNRHVAEPWDFDQEALAARARGFEAVPLRLLGYMSKGRGPFELRLVDRAVIADVALLLGNGLAGEAEPLLLSRRVPDLGQSVYVIGYPAGLRALLARAEAGLADSLITGDQSDFWTLAATLSGAGQIAPLVTRGIVGQVTPTVVVYDAQTTHGGSGGPVVGRDGLVYAVNAAILPEFSGSNIGVRADSASWMLDRFAGRTPIE